MMICVILGVWAKCANFPDLNAQKHPSHELLSELREDIKVSNVVSVDAVEVLVLEKTSSAD